MIENVFKAFLAFNAGYLLMVVGVMASTITDPLFIALTGFNRNNRDGGGSFFESDSFIITVCALVLAFITSFLSVLLLVHAGDKREPLLAKVAAGAYGLYALLQLVALGLLLDPIVTAQLGGADARPAEPLSAAVQFTVTVQVLGRLYDIAGCVLIILFARRVHLRASQSTVTPVELQANTQYEQQQQQQHSVGMGNYNQEMHSARY
jgi:hypothetical protein